jgi:hypothetical protein
MAVQGPQLERAEFEFHRALNRIASPRRLSWLPHAALGVWAEAAM